MSGREKKFLEAYFLRSITRESVFGVPAPNQGERWLEYELMGREAGHHIVMCRV